MRMKWVTLILAGLIMLPVQAGAVQRDTERDESWIAQAITLPRIVTDSRDAGNAGALSPGYPAVWSADRTRFFVVTRRGELGCDCNIFTLSVYRASDLEQAVRAGLRIAAPQFQIELQSRSNTPAIDRPAWQDDSIIFVGVPATSTRTLFGPRALYRLDGNGVLTRLSAEGRDVLEYAIQNDVAAYTAVDQILPDHVLRDYPGTALAGDELSSLISPFERFSRSLHFTRAGDGEQSLASNMVAAFAASPSLSPDAAWLIATVPASRDGGARGSETTSFLISSTAPDARARTIPTGLASPAGYRLRWKAPPTAYWSHDSRRALLVNAMPDGHLAQLIDYDPASGEARSLEPLETDTGGRTRRVSDIRWLVPGHAVQVSHDMVDAGNPASDGAPADTVTYVYGASGWEVGTSSPTGSAPQAVSGPPVAISLRTGQHGGNELVASMGQGAIAIVPEDPTLSRSPAFRVVPLQWRDAEGASVTARLFLPAGTPPRTHPPLVIQAVSEVGGLFEMDADLPGQYPRALAERGVATLLLPYADLRGRESPAEGPAWVSRFEQAIDQLRPLDLVDLDRVGMTGFSRAGWLSFFAASHPSRTPLRAIAAIDSISYGYIEYAMQLSSTTVSPRLRMESYERVLGGDFWRNREAWLENSPLFNANRIRAAVLFSAHGRINQLLTVEQVAALRSNNVPFSALYLPEATHQLRRPRERLFLADRMLNWMTCWLTSPVQRPDRGGLRQDNPAIQRDEAGPRCRVVE